MDAPYKLLYGEIVRRFIIISSRISDVKIGDLSVFSVSKVSGPYD